MPTDISAPYMKQFVHSKSQQYRRLKMEWRNNVFLRRSGIQVGIQSSFCWSKYIYSGRRDFFVLMVSSKDMYQCCFHWHFLWFLSKTCIIIVAIVIICLQGLGLFAARDLEKHTMVIEYIGELIRNEVAEYREKLYDSQVNCWKCSLV